MIVIILKNTLEVQPLAQFLNSHKNINTKSIQITPELIAQLDENAVYFEMPEPPIINEKFEVLEIAEPLQIEGEWHTFWKISRLGPDAINDFYNDVVDDNLDAIAKTKGWKNQDRLLSAIDSANANFEQEARYMRQLVDRTWEKAIPIINTEVKELVDNPAKRPMSSGELLEQLPKWDMPPGF